ncbi:MAG: hypothetical protein WAM44_15840, partial [Chthoniobacterales bacterium]
GGTWELESRFKDPVSVNLVNQGAYRGVEPDVLERMLSAEGVVPEWKEMLRVRRSSELGARRGALYFGGARLPNGRMAFTKILTFRSPCREQGRLARRAGPSANHVAILLDSFRGRAWHTVQRGSAGVGRIATNPNRERLIPSR